MAVSNIIKYKDYRAAIEFDAESECFVGNVLGIRDAIFFGGETVAELKMRFRDCIETYLEACPRVFRIIQYQDISRNAQEGCPGSRQGTYLPQPVRSEGHRRSGRRALKESLAFIP